jgi:hypothetical protein
VSDAPSERSARRAQAAALLVEHHAEHVGDGGCPLCPVFDVTEHLIEDCFAVLVGDQLRELAELRALNETFQANLAARTHDVDTLADRIAGLAPTTPGAPTDDDPVDRYVCDAGHHCGTVWPEDGTCPQCGADVSSTLDAHEIASHLRVLLEAWGDYRDVVPSAAIPSALIDVGNALFHLRPWLARMATVLDGGRDGS